jgi:hypothetical protein
MVQEIFNMTSIYGLVTTKREGFFDNARKTRERKNFANTNITRAASTIA